MSVIIQVRRDASSNWTSVNPVLADGELAYDKNNSNFKIGNGVSSYTQLPNIIPAAVGTQFSGTNVSGTLNSAGISLSVDPAAAGVGTNFSGTNISGTLNTSGISLSVAAPTVTAMSWGALTGNISDQSDLNNALSAKLTKSHSGHAGIVRIDAADITTNLNTQLYARVADNTGVFVYNGQLTDVMTITGISTDTYALTDDVTNYIVADYNGGSPVFKVITDEALIDYALVLPYAEMFKRTGSNNPHTQLTCLRNIGEVEQHNHRVFATERYAVESGMDGVAVDTSLKITGNAGVVWSGNYRYAMVAITSATRHFTCVYSGTWAVSSGIDTSINNTQYNDPASGMVNLTTGYYGIAYLYRGIENEDHLYVVYGQEEFANEDLALAAGLPPTLPAIISTHAMLIARVVYLKSATTFTVESAIGVTFNGSSAVNTHNSLMGLQGGDTAGQYYHLKSADHANLTNNAFQFSSGTSAITAAAFPSANSTLLAESGHTHSQYLTTAALSDHLHSQYLTTAALSVHTHDYQSTGAYLTTAALSNHTHGNVSLALTNINGTTASASNGLTLSLSAGAGGAGDGGNVIAVAGSTAASTGTIVFSNSNNITFGLNGGTITASFSQSADPDAWSLVGNTAGTTNSAYGGSLYLSGGDNITLSGNSNTIVISAAAGGGGAAGTMGGYEIYQMDNNTAFSSNGQNTLYMQKFNPPVNVSFNNFERYVSVNIVTSTNSQTVQETIRYGLYSLDGANSYNLIASSSVAITASNSNGSYSITVNAGGTNNFSTGSAGSNIVTQFTGARHMYFPFASTITVGGRYAVAFLHSTASVVNTGAWRMSQLVMTNINNLTWGKLSPTGVTASNTSHVGDWAQGVYATTTGAMPSAIAKSQMSNAVSLARMYLQLDA